LVVAAGAVRGDLRFGRPGLIPGCGLKFVGPRPITCDGLPGAPPGVGTPGLRRVVVQPTESRHQADDAPPATPLSDIGPPDRADPPLAR